MDEDLKKALDVLHQGGIILYPTDTIWGIGCDACNEKAVHKIFEIKQRNDSKSLIVLLDKEGKLQNYMDEVPEMAWDLLELSDTPLTIIYPKGKNVAPNLLAEDGTIAIRICKTPFVQKLLERFKRPLVSTSANISGMPSPNGFNEISEEIKQQMDYIVKTDQEKQSSNSPSSILKLGVGGEIKVIR